MSSNNKVPPQFGNFGKKAKDLFKKKYEYEYQAIFVNKTADGTDLETKVIASNNAPVRGSFKSTVPVTTVGAFNGVMESEFHTVANRESKTTYKFSKLANGASLKVGLTGVKSEVKGETPEFGEGWASAEVEYVQEHVASNVAVRTNLQKTVADVALALGYDNLAVGAKATIDAASRSAPTDYNFGAELTGTDYVATAVTEKKRSALTLSYFQSVNKEQTVGASATFGLVKPSRSLTFGTDYRLDASTNARGFVRVDSTRDDATLALAVEHRLAKPNVLIGVATEYSISPSAVSAGKFGLTLTYGDI